MKIRLWLTVEHGQVFRSEIWYRDLETSHAPGPGDRVVLWSEDGDPHEGPLWDVRRRYWDAAGGVHCELARLIVDPTDATRQAMRNAVAHGSSPAEESPWYKAVDGDPGPKLRAGGWSNR